MEKTTAFGGLTGLEGRCLFHRSGEKFLVLLLRLDGDVISDGTRGPEGPETEAL